MVAFMASSGFSFYIYAPKGDPFLRKRWLEPLPTDFLTNLSRLAGKLHDAGLELGVGLSPYEIYRSFDAESKTALEEKIQHFISCGVDHLAILFDDMRGDLPRLAERQVEILHWIQERSKFSRLSMCPTYYSSDPVLDRIFGARPPEYLEELGTRLDSAIDLYWTGEQICSAAYSSEHLNDVAKVLRRKPLLWDNYPVNDGQRMCKFLHLRGFTGRPAALEGLLSAHAVNPMNQAFLSRIPALTLRDSYRLRGGYDANRAFELAAVEVLGPRFAARLGQDLADFQDAGLDGMTAERKGEHRRAYSAFDHPAAREIVAWLDGRYEVSRELVLTQ